MIMDSEILIIIPRVILSSRDHKKYVMPIGLAYISSVLKRNHYKVDFLNLNFYGESVEEIIKMSLLKKEYNYVLTGAICTYYFAIKDCVDATRKYTPSSKIILGGGLVSSKPELIFKSLHPDYIVIGEGEVTILELLKCLEEKGDLSKVDGIAYSGSEGKIVLTNPRKPLEDIDSLPWPDYEGLGLEANLEQIKPSTMLYYDLFDFPRPYPLIISRSCPFSCTFCYHPAGDKYRQRSIQNVLDELTFAIKRYKINLIDIYDELLSNNKARIYDLCKRLSQLFKDVPWDVKWSCQLRVDTVTEELIKTMKDAGCYLISLGLESYSAEVLKSMNKKITPQQIDNALRIIHRFNITITGNFIFGDIAETKQTICETLKYWKNNYHNILGGAVALGHVQVYPGTPIYEHALKKGIIVNELDFIQNHLGKPINITDRITGQEFDRLLKGLNYTMLTYPNCKRPRFSRKVNGVYEIHVQCPYCKVTSIYRNYEPPGTGTYQKQDICCRNCRMRFFVVTLTNNLFVTLLRVIGPCGVFILNPIRKLHKAYVRYCQKVIAKRTK
jgi:anaerobic magnesium-protoporphyrin IX monomethyl ester cyclase